MSRKCPYCEKEYPEVSRYCPYCGSPNPSYKQKEEPKMHYWRQLLLFGVGFIGFQVLGTLIQLIFLAIAKSNFGTDKTAISNYLASAPVSMFVNAIAYCIIFCALLFIAKPGIQNLIKSFKNKKAYLGALLAFVIVYAFNIFYSVLLAGLGAKVESNNNEATLDSIIKVYPLVSIIVFGFIGPVCEELTYRVGFFDFFKRKNRILAYVATIIIFTLIHFDFGAETMTNELLNIPYYAAAAFAFTFAYDQYGFAASVTAHVANNLFSVITEII